MNTPSHDVSVAASHAPPELKKFLRPLHLWAIAVGLVISGDYFGWNFGLKETSPLGMLIAVLFVTLMYVCFIFSYTELSTAIPHSGGPYAFARRALGPFGGLIAGVATLLEFVFAPPAIALAIGSYVHFRMPQFGKIEVAVLMYLIFAALNCWGVELAVTFELFVTALAVFELLLFFGICGPHVKLSNLLTQPLLPRGVSGIFAALPFAIWFYLALEGVAMSAEEVVSPERDIPRGYIAGLCTLVVLALGTLICTSGVTTTANLTQDESPLPRAMATVLTPDHIMTHLMVYIGLFGLIASFHGIMMGYSRQVFALARGGYLPSFLSYLHPKRKTPVWAVIVPGLVGLVVVLLDKTEQAITLSSIGATILYVVSMVSLLVLRKREPDLRRPFHAPLFPVFPLVALSLAGVCLVAVVSSQPRLALLAALLFALAIVYYQVIARHRVTATNSKL
mgnify:FL=1